MSELEQSRRNANFSDCPGRSNTAVLAPARAAARSRQRPPFAEEVFGVLCPNELVYAFAMILEADPAELKEAVEAKHGSKATFLQAVPVHYAFRGPMVWEGVVHVFDLEGHPRASRVYAWAEAFGPEGKERRYWAILHEGPVQAPMDAIKASILHRQAKWPRKN